MQKSVLRLITIFLILAQGLLISCNETKKLTAFTQKSFLSDSIISHAHLGISFYDYTNGKSIFEQEGRKHFIPGSTMKLLTLYAGLKYLDTNIVGCYYKETEDTLYLFPSGDPTLLHHYFARQPLIDYLQKTNKYIVLLQPVYLPQSYANGVSWEDQQQKFMAQRSIMPVYGNLLQLNWTKDAALTNQKFSYQLQPDHINLPDMIINKQTDTSLSENTITKVPGSNQFDVVLNNKNDQVEQSIPFECNGIKSTYAALEKYCHHNFLLRITTENDLSHFNKIYSQNRDSVFYIMMHESDNFFADQTLLMIAQKELGKMNTEEIIDRLLTKDFSDLDKKIRWVDGSGLSRYNLISPNNEVIVIKKLIDSFGIERLTTILPTGGEGTLKTMFKEAAGNLYAKSGSMGNQYCLSGFFYTKSKRMILFSIMANQYIGSSRLIRKKTEAYLEKIMSLLN